MPQYSSIAPSIWSPVICLLQNDVGRGVCSGGFTRRMRATLIVALSIPYLLVGHLYLLRMADRSLDVISLAGLAFAVGMVLDAAIVVLGTSFA